MTDEKKPPQEVASTEAKLQRSVRSNEHLIEKLYALDCAFGVATRAARASGELKLMDELEKRWDEYAAFLSPVLLGVPAKLFE